MGWRDGERIDGAPSGGGWRSGVPLDAAPARRPTGGMTGGPAYPGGSAPPPMRTPSVDVIPPEEMQADAALSPGFTGIGVGVQPPPAATGGAEPYQAGGGGWLSDAIWAPYTLIPGLGPLAMRAWTEGMTPRDAAREVAQGASFGASDEALAYARTLMGEDYGAALAQERQANKAVEQAFPTTSVGMQAVGGTGAGLLMGAAAGGLGVAAPATTAGRIGAGAAGGAAAGAVDAFNRGEGGVGPRLEQAGAGAITGGVFGAALPLAGRMGGLIWNKLRGPASTAYEDALRIINSRMRSDSVTPEAVGRRLTDLGPDAMMVDAAGPNVLRLGGSAYRAPGEGSTIAYDRLSERARGQSSRVYDAFTEAYTPGGPRDYFEAVDSLMTQRAAASKPLYDAAFARGTGVLDARVDQFLADPIVLQGLKQGLEIQRLEALAAGKPFDPTEYAITGFNEAGDPVMGTVPNFRLLDAAKRGLDDILEGYRDPLTGRLNLGSRGRAIESVRKAYVSHLDTLNPDYAAARAAWAGPSQALDAMSLGARIVTEDNREITRLLSGMSANEREFVQVGVVDAVRKALRSAPDGADAVKRIFGSSWKRDALAALFDDPAKFAMFRQQMEAESAFFRTQHGIMGNSATAERGAADAANGLPNFGQTMGGGLALDAATGQLPGTSAMARMFLDTLLSDAPRATPATYEEISRMLFSRTPADNARTLDALRNAGIYDRRLGGGLLGAQSGLSGSLSGEIVPPQGLLGVRLR